jgi:hypothetical protein
METGHAPQDGAGELKALWTAELRWRQEQLTGLPSQYRPGKRWDGGTDQWGRNNKPFWPRAVQFLQNHQVDDWPFYVKVQFDAHPGRSLQPNILVSQEAVSRYREARQRSQGDAVEALALQVREFQNRLVLAMALFGGQRRLSLCHVLGDPSANLSALFRYYVLARSGLTEEAEVWLAPALAQFGPSAEAYEEVWGPWPEGAKAGQEVLE